MDFFDSVLAAFRPRPNYGTILVHVLHTRLKLRKGKLQLLENNSLEKLLAQPDRVAEFSPVQHVPDWPRRHLAANSPAHRAHLARCRRCRAARGQQERESQPEHLHLNVNLEIL